MIRWIAADHNRPQIYGCHSGGANIFFAYSPFFRSSMIKSFFTYVQCLGGIWTTEWTESMLFPLAISLVADNPGF
jgi:hypothetical protein